MIVLVDYNLTGYVVLFQGTLASEGWLDLLSIRFVTLKDAGLAVDSNDRIIWRFAQSKQIDLTTPETTSTHHNRLPLGLTPSQDAASFPIHCPDGYKSQRCY